jgi:uncharacterized protein DUF3768
MMTAAVSALPDDVRARAIELTRTFDDFTPDNDPYNEHDFGSFEIDDQKFIAVPKIQVTQKNNTRPHDHARGRILRRRVPLGVWSSICPDKSLLGAAFLRADLRITDNPRAVPARLYWSGRRDSNPRPQPWQGCALPLSYTRSVPVQQARLVARLFAANIA